MRRVKSLLIFIFLLAASLQGNEILIHEGLMTAVKELQPLLAIPTEPPSDIQEKVPEQPSGDVTWLPGYWSWQNKTNDFAWVNGFWRKAPPGKIWIKGKWQELNGHWVWLKGFWSEKPLNKMAFIEHAPPDLIEETIEKPADEHHFWVPGHYVYKKGYKWVKGYWDEFDLNWVLVPDHYGWRPEGYYYIAAFWDWPIEERGQIFSSLDPVTVIPQEEIVQKFFYNYPDYLSFFAHYKHFHPNSLAEMPPWWSWQTWWTYNWPNQWALWWWYTHPGYIQPKWMTEAMSSNIMPPPRALEAAILDVYPPLIVTPNGVISTKKAAKELRKIDVSKSSAFILPLNKLREFQKAVMPRLKTHFKPLLPTGKKNAMLLSRHQFVQKHHDRKSKSPIKPYLKKLKNKLNNYEIAVDNSTTQTQKYWEEEIRERDKRHSRAWQERRAEFNQNSADTIKNWDDSVKLRNLERGTYAEETERHELEDLRKQVFWQPQMDAREVQLKEEEKADAEMRRRHEQEFQEERVREGYLSYSRDDARRDAIRSDSRRYMQKRDDIRRDNFRYQQNQETIKRDNMQYQQHQEDLQRQRLQQNQKSWEDKKRDEKFWEELQKLERERGDVSINEIDTSKNNELMREQQQKEDEKFWEEQERDHEETRRRASHGNADIIKFGLPLPEAKDPL